VIQLLDKNDMRKSISNNGRKYYSENYSWEVIEKKVVREINALIEKNKG
jgi:glycosyltransferase involved in cell wall biosynthesis